MFNFITKRIVYGILVMIGVCTIVFFLFNILPGDPARMMLGQHATQDQITAINRELGRDKPLSVQYLMYLNDVSPLSINDVKNPASYVYLDKKKYTNASELFPVSKNKSLVVKFPYLRRSYINKRLVSEIILDTFPETFVLAATSILIASFFGILLGIIAAVKKNTWFDSGSLVFAVLGMSGPSFFLGLIIAMVFGYLWSKEFPMPVVPVLTLFFGIAVGILHGYKKKKNNELEEKLFDFAAHRALRWFMFGVIYWIFGYFFNKSYNIFPFINHHFILPGTGLNNEGSLFPIDDFGEEHLSLKNLILPSIALGIRPLALILQLTRSSLLDVLSQDYIRTATAKGLSYYKVIFKHALKNALNPVITSISGWFAGLMAGSVFVEQIFAWRGIGSELVGALDKQDLPIVMGGTLFVGMIFVIINIAVDIIYGVLDPRVRVQ